jgi:hypothetical protein
MRQPSVTRQLGNCVNSATRLRQLGNSATRQLGNSATRLRQLGNSATRQLGNSATRQLGCGNSATRQLGCGNSATRQGLQHYIHPTAVSSSTQLSAHEERNKNVSNKNAIILSDFSQI